jgi:hypothetical protein
MLTNYLSYKRQCIRERRLGIGIPGILTIGDLAYVSMSISKQSHHGDQRQQGWRCLDDGPIGQLKLGLHAEVIPNFKESDFQLPINHEPNQNLVKLFDQVHAQQSLRLRLVFWIENQSAADWHRRHAIMKPNRCCNNILNFSSSFVIPVGNEEFLQTRLSVTQVLFQSGHPLAFLAGPPLLARSAIRSWFIQDHIQSKSSDQSPSMGQFYYWRQKIEGRITAIRHNHLVSPRQLTSGLQNHLLGSNRRIMSPFALFIVVFGRQCPNSTLLGDRRNHHQAQPSEAARFDEDEVDVSRTRWISANELALDLGSQVKLDRIIKSKYSLPKSSKCSHQFSQKNPAHFSVRLDGSAAHSMELLRVGRHRSFYRSQDCPKKQNVRSKPYFPTEEIGEVCENREEVYW